MRIQCYLSFSSFISSLFSKTPSPFLYHSLSLTTSSSSSSFLSFKTLPINKTAIFHLSSAIQSSTAPIPSEDKTHLSKPKTKKERQASPESQLRFKLDACSKKCDVKGALRLYDDARSRGIPLSQYHYNVLLYLCSASKEAELDANPGANRGFEIFRQMGVEKIRPNEATFTSLARLAASMDDLELAFEMVKNMASSRLKLKLRSYGPALFGFCRKGEAQKAYEVFEHMEASGVAPEEPELAALLRVSVDSGKGDKVYQILHRLRAKVRQVEESTAGIVEGWFGSVAAAEVGEVGWDVEKVKEGVVKGGGGWHGQGWLGKGNWRVVRTHMDEHGVCGSCGEKLACIDIDPMETKNFASSLSSLACRKEVKANFTAFKEWLVHHGPFEAAIDGANMGIYNKKDFSFSQLNSVVKKIQQMSPTKKLPLIVLHDGRAWAGPAWDPNNRQLLQSWRRSGVLYTVPAGSNDDWYWLYAAVSCNCLLVTNDEMRDHLFALLGTSFFPRWKEKHQVRLSFSKQGPIFHMPPPYSVVIQESESGRWHVPIATGVDIETNRQWISAEIILKKRHAAHVHWIRAICFREILT
ncbi:hypothetical protein MRB53_022859 [Persea americana]|uniref:Uncharacterized protein n=1 Tax=Persea americana TaxID=3435 RepID=A0ACC2L7Y4_PERAE|nr:hypothetical protein MRB53_022859 [Persea americana]